MARGGSGIGGEGGLGDLAALRYYDNMWQGQKRGAVRAVHDLGELAARLGSANVYERRGDVVFMDSFEHGLVHWTTASFGSGSGLSISQFRTRTGGHAVKLTPGTDSSRLAQLYRILAPLPTSDATYPGWGLEFSFVPHEDMAYTTWHLYRYTGATVYMFRARYDHASQEVQYQNAASAWVVLASALDLHSPVSYQFSTGKLVVDPTTNTYMRFLLNDTEYTAVAGVAPLSASNSQPAGMYVEISAEAQASLGSAPSTYVDDVILTQNEPA